MTHAWGCLACGEGLLIFLGPCPFWFGGDLTVRTVFGFGVVRGKWCRYPLACRDVLNRKSVWIGLRLWCPYLPNAGYSTPIHQRSKGAENYEEFYPNWVQLGPLFYWELAKNPRASCAGLGSHGLLVRLRDFLPPAVVEVWRVACFWGVLLQDPKYRKPTGYKL